MREAANQHNIFIRTLCLPFAVLSEAARAQERGHTSSSSGTSASPAHGPARQ